ncbi:MAG: TetR/AcrR family transcriptional regulator [Halieaceae bacterium]|jgi:AcrR family transcriptional regulator|nr:TetR/AcrR family transcriptional regulator [Halieaceae bacterium]
MSADLIELAPHASDMRGGGRAATRKGYQYMGKQVSLAYKDYLHAEMERERGKRKGERTRDRLLYAGACVLDDVGYRDSRVADICALAEVSTASFYTYFENRTVLAQDILTGFLHSSFRSEVEVPRKYTAFEALRVANTRWIQIVMCNAGLIRCVLQLGDEEPVFAELYRRANQAWCEYVAGVITERYVPKRSNRQVVLLAVHCLGAMMDEISRELADGSDTLLGSITAEIAPGEEELAEFLSVIWYRTLYGAVPQVRLRAKAARDLARLALKPSA